MHNVFDELYVFSHDGTVLHFVDGDLRAEYSIADGKCTCPAGVHGCLCKHVRMLSQDYAQKTTRPWKAKQLVINVSEAIEKKVPDGLRFSRSVEKIVIPKHHEEKLIVGIIEGMVFYLV